MSDPSEFVRGLIHEETQVSSNCVDLTVGHVYALDGPGRLDFGGDEYAEPDAVPLEPERANEEYGWWDLEAGTYLVGYNETLRSSEADFLLQPHPRLLATGARHPTTRVTELPRVPLVVPESGVAIKENARVSVLQRHSV